VRPDEARPRLAALGFAPEDVEVLAGHFLDAEERGQAGHGLSRIEWLETWDEIDTSARPVRLVSEPGYERWDGGGALGYLTLDAAVEAQLAAPPDRARLVVCSRTFPTGALGYWVRRLAQGGLVALLTATSPRRLASPDGGPPLAGTNPLAIGIPSSDGVPVVADVSMGAVTHGAVLAGLARPEELVPFGGEQSHKAFALAVGLQLLVDSLVDDDEHGAVMLVARPEADPVPALRSLAGDVRLPGSPALP
jgi:LDH2 family malate/lactate/ureidoglycolate dehydrogenase